MNIAKIISNSIKWSERLTPRGESFVTAGADILKMKPAEIGETLNISTTVKGMTNAVKSGKGALKTPEIRAAELKQTLDKLKISGVSEDLINTANINIENYEIAMQLLDDSRVQNCFIPMITRCINKENVDIAKNILSKPEVSFDTNGLCELIGIFSSTTKNNTKLLNKYYKFGDKSFAALLARTKKDTNIANLAETMLKDKEISRPLLNDILDKARKGQYSVLSSAYKEKDFQKLYRCLFDENQLKNLEYIGVNIESIKTAKDLSILYDIAGHTREEGLKIIKKLYSNPNIPKDCIDVLSTSICQQQGNIDLLVQFAESKNVPAKIKSIVFRYNGTDRQEKIIAFYNKFKKPIDFNKLSRAEKRELIDYVMSQKNNITENRFVEMKKYCPDMPSNEEEYVEFISKLSKSLDIPLTSATEKEMEIFNQQIAKIISKPEITKGSLTELRKVFPDLTESSIKSLQKIVKNPNFEKLSESDKRVLTLATLLHDSATVGSRIEDLAFDAYFVARKYGMSEQEAQKVYTIIDTSDIVKQFMNTTRKNGSKEGYSEIRQRMKDRNRHDILDFYASKLKENNNFELAQMLYSTKNQSGFTRHLDKILKQRIDEIKATDFVLLQTPKNVYQQMAKYRTVVRDGVEYRVPVVHSSEIDNFYAVIHTPEANFAGACSNNGRMANLINFDYFGTLNNNKSICTSYISGKYNNLTRNFKHALILNTKNNAQYAAYPSDIQSSGKNVAEVVTEFFAKNGTTAGSTNIERAHISNNLKTQLFEKDYYTLNKKVNSTIESINSKYTDKIKKLNNSRKELIRNLVGKENITTQEYLSVRNNPEVLKIENQIIILERQRQVEINNVEGLSELMQMDNDYIRRLDNIKTQIRNETLTPEKLEQIDSEFAKAYKKFLSKGKSDGENVEHILLDCDGLKWNEIIISNPQVSAISTADFEHLPTEYLIKAQKDNLPIVIID